MVKFDKDTKNLTIPSALGNFRSEGGVVSGVTPEQVQEMIDSSITAYDETVQGYVESASSALTEQIEAVSGAVPTISVEQALSAGTKIGAITLNGAETELFAPEGGDFVQNYQIVSKLDDVIDPQEGTKVYVQSGSSIETWSGYSFDASALEDGAPVATIGTDMVDIFYIDYYDGDFYGNVEWENDGQLHYAEGLDYDSGKKYECAYIADVENKVFSIFMADLGGLTAFADEGVVSGETSTGVTVSWESGQFMYDGSEFVPETNPRKVINLTDLSYGQESADLFDILYGLSESGVNLNDLYVFTASVSNPDTYQATQITLDFSYVKTEENPYGEDDYHFLIFNGISDGMSYKLTFYEDGYTNTETKNLDNSKTGVFAIDFGGNPLSDYSNVSVSDLVSGLLNWINYGSDIKTLNEMFCIKTYMQQNNSYVPYGTGRITTCMKPIGSSNRVIFTIEAPILTEDLNTYCTIMQWTVNATYYTWDSGNKETITSYDWNNNNYKPQTTVKYSSQDIWPGFNWSNLVSGTWGPSITRPDGVKIFETFIVNNGPSSSLVIMGQGNFGKTGSTEGNRTIEYYETAVMFDEDGNQYVFSFQSGSLSFYHSPEQTGTWEYGMSQGASDAGIYSGETTDYVDVESVKMLSGTTPLNQGWVYKDVLNPKTYYLENMTSAERVELYNFIKGMGPKMPPITKFAKFYGKIEQDGYVGECELFFCRYDGSNKIVFVGDIASRNSDVLYKKVITLKSDGSITETTTNYNLKLPTASQSTLGGVKVGSGLTIDGNGLLSVSGGTGGSSVSVQQTLTAGTKIATITVDGTGTDLFAPAGGGGGGGDTNYLIVDALSAITTPVEGMYVYVNSASTPDGPYSAITFDSQLCEGGYISWNDGGYMWLSGDDPTMIDNGGGWYQVPQDGQWHMSNGDRGVIYAKYVPSTHMYSIMFAFNVSDLNISINGTTYETTEETLPLSVEGYFVRRINGQWLRTEYHLEKMTNSQRAQAYNELVINSGMSNTNVYWNPGSYTDGQPLKATNIVLHLNDNYIKITTSYYQRIFEINLYNDGHFDGRNNKDLDVVVKKWEFTVSSVSDISNVSAWTANSFSSYDGYIAWYNGYEIVAMVQSESEGKLSYPMPVRLWRATDNDMNSNYNFGFNFIDLSGNEWKTTWYWSNQEDHPYMTSITQA